MPAPRRSIGDRLRLFGKIKRALAGLWSPFFQVFDGTSIDRKYRRLKAAGIYLGDPVGPELIAARGQARYRRYQNGAISWYGGGSGVREVHGPIAARWHASTTPLSDGFPSPYWGFPVSDQQTTRDGAGHFNDFQHGSIYWTKATGAVAVAGQVRARWRSLGAETGRLGYPTSDTQIWGPTVNGADPGGEYGEFQAGSIHVGTGRGTFVLSGPIREVWVRWGKHEGLGHPVTDILPTSDGQGRFCLFHNYDAHGDHAVFWSPATGAHAVIGAIRAKWAELGEERGRLGYPITDEMDWPGVPGGRVSEFRGGRIFWTRSHGTRVEVDPSGEGGAPSKRLTHPLTLNADPIFEGIQPYSGHWPGPFQLAGTIVSINVPQSHPGDLYAVSFLKPGLDVSSISEPDATVTVASGDDLVADRLRIFTDPAQKSVALRAVSTRPAQPFLMLSVTVALD